ncbi:hypothetical protein F5879DRAFT_995282 [Lentinula edodes]|nr:hypothetical protein F5879DRAFT_995282 [Lentinula edodes]
MSPSRDAFSDSDALCSLDLDDTHYANSPSFCPKDNFSGNELPPSNSSTFEADDSNYLSDAANYSLHKAAEDNSDYPDAVDTGEAEDADEDREELWIADQVPDFDVFYNLLQDRGTFHKKDMIHSQQSSDLDKLLLSLLEDEPAPTQNSFSALPASAFTTSSTQHLHSYFATSNSDPGSRKRRHSQVNHKEHIPRQRHSAVNTHADPVEPRPDCNRNGGSASRKRLRVDSQADRQDVEEEEEEEAPDGTQYLYEASQTPHAPPKEVTDVALAWMLHLTGVVGWGSDKWAEDIRSLVAAVDWEEAFEALSSDSLLHLTQRCRHTEKVNTGSTFIQMMYELFLAAKVNR